MWKFKIAVALSIIFTSSVAFGQSTPDETAVKSIESEYRNAVMKNDIDFFSKHIAPGYLGTEDDGLVVDGPSLLAARKNNAFRVRSFEVVNQTIRISGPTAVVSECLRLNYTRNGKSHTGDFQVTRIWQKAATDWLVLAFQQTPRSSPCRKVN